MIHQLIFASPKPGMTEEEFQRYWVEVHAVRYASKIPQIRRYLIDTRIPLPGEKGEPEFSGIAEIWLENEQEQLESLQTPEFLEGARRDEPNWAAFWKTLALDTDASVLFGAEEPERSPNGVKLVTLYKRAPGMALWDFRTLFRSEVAQRVRELPGLRRYVQCHVRDSFYAVGESRFDCVDMLWFDDLDVFQKAYQSSQWRALATTRERFVEPRYIFPFLTREHWIIGPRVRSSLPSGSLPAPVPDPSRKLSLFEAVSKRDRASVKAALERGANPNARDGNGMTPLLIASGYGYLEIVQELLDGGAEVLLPDAKAGAFSLHKAAQGGHLDIVKLLLDKGAFIDAQTATTGHTPLLEAIWFKQADVAEYLLERGARLNIPTHYSFDLEQHLTYESQVNTGRDADQLQRIRRAVEQRKQGDAQRIAAQKLMAAVMANNEAQVRELLRKDEVQLDERYPATGDFQDSHTPLLVAVRDGRDAIAQALIEAGADINALEPTFLAAPLHKATYNGRVLLTRMLARQRNIHLDIRGATNGYTPVMDALWHGFRDCARVLIDAGADLTPRGHDGKSALDIAIEVLGKDDDLIQVIASKLQDGRSPRGTASSQVAPGLTKVG
jgi:ankyrin repeat protein